MMANLSVSEINNLGLRVEQRFISNYNNDKQNNSNYVDAIDTIVAQATAIGVGGVGIVRVSGAKDKILFIIKNILRVNLRPRYAYYGNFYDTNIISNSISNRIKIIDKGIALYFPAPNSYTGEDILELHCHGGPIVIDIIINNILSLGARSAEPGEFAKRAWLNGKMDLTQVEAVCDLINATSKQAAQSAANSLTGEFSNIIKLFLTDLIKLRTYVEAAIDFSDEQIDFIESGEVKLGISLLRQKLNSIISSTKQGVILQEGVNIVIAGRPNAGKSSLLNILCRREEAIVTDIPGTTRDIIKTNLSIKGLPVCLVDTAGLRDTEDLIEQEGVKRAVSAIKAADFLLLIIDCSLADKSALIKKLDDINQLELQNIIKHELADSDRNNDFNFYDNLELINNNKFVLIMNKTDKVFGGVDYSVNKTSNNVLFVSVKDNIGINKLEEHILNKVGFQQTNEGKFTARRRHLESLRQVEQCLIKAGNLLGNNVNNNLNNNMDVIAEELRQAQDCLSSITGEYTSDDLLGSIFSSFCIGK